MTVHDIADVTGAVVTIEGWFPQKQRNRNPMQVSAPKSTDTEMYQALEKDLLISSDYQAGLAQNVTQVLEVAGGVKPTRDICSVQFREPDEEEEEVALAVLLPKTLVIAYLQETSASGQGSNRNCKCFNCTLRRRMTGTQV